MRQRLLREGMVGLQLLLCLHHAAGAPATYPMPTPQQLHYMDNELTMFMHFSICTFNDGCNGGQQNCGYDGQRQPWPASSFDPTDVDTEQWAQTALDLGAKQVCLTTHHSGGFALWPTKASNYSIEASPFGKTGRDIVKEFVGTMRSHDLEPCFYIVLNMDCAETHNSAERYLEIQTQMLTELLSNYGPIPRMWWDMVSSNLAPEWNPGGFPANFRKLAAHAKGLAPQTMLLPGTDGCLVGGETGSGSYPVFNFNEGELTRSHCHCQQRHACCEIDTPFLRDRPDRIRLPKNGLGAECHTVAHLRSSRTGRARAHTHTLTLTFSQSVTLSLTHSLAPSLPHPLTVSLCLAGPYHPQSGRHVVVGQRSRVVLCSAALRDVPRDDRAWEHLHSKHAPELYRSHPGVPTPVTIPLTMPLLLRSFDKASSSPDQVPHERICAARPGGEGIVLSRIGCLSTGRPDGHVWAQCSCAGAAGSRSCWRAGV